MLQNRIFSSFLQRSRKRKIEENEFNDDIEHIFPGCPNEEEVIGSVVHGVVQELRTCKARKYPKIQNRDRTHQKVFWTNGCTNWTDDEFKERLRINRENFEFILIYFCIRPLFILFHILINFIIFSNINFLF